MSSAIKPYFSYKRLFGEHTRFKAVIEPISRSIAAASSAYG
ncbi:MAG TPA: hypothetical protein VIW25_00080 [Nitrososphaeraceae archaeon]